ncbi:FtsX-like permease family protein [uncultured Pseudokineococcus sp.]|uniref:FtsX-like permease family protein n=1 Tax=uncultured Pseudokineococcus sp. TaxID=1642928 RepID=UPI002626043C|nr:FtsX-like permease family protein [uncultured Pseudokineococcus sp.]
MTATALARTGAGPTPPPRRPRRALAQWAADLALGVRLSVSGGRAGWVRLALIAVGIGLGVTMLLGAATAPAVVAAQEARSNDRSTPMWEPPEDAVAAGPGTILTIAARSQFRDTDVEGVLVQAEGDAPPVPPGVARLPGPGEVVLSPALADLMATDGAEALRGRWGEAVGTIGPEGLRGPDELTFYAGSDQLSVEEFASRTDRFGGVERADPDPDPTLLVLAMVATTVLLLPVAIFVTSAVRFGSEARDRRLAALRLVGADARMARRVAAGETLTGAVLGLALGGVLFAALLLALPDALGVFAGDLRPVPALVALVVVLVPVAAVVVTVAAMQRVVVEPLGVVRRSGDRRRRLWWRLVLPVIGLVLVAPLLAGRGIDTFSDTEQLSVPVGLGLLLLGVALLLPWLVEASVRHLGGSGGGVAWQLSVRRLQLDSGTSVRAVSGIAVSVAGLLVINGIVAGLESGETEVPQRDAADFQAVVYDNSGAEPRWGPLEGSRGIREISTLSSVVTTDPATGADVWIDIGECAALAVDTEVGDCADGDVFAAAPTNGTVPTAGTTLDLGEPGSSEAASTWTVPETLTTVPTVTGMMSSPEGEPARFLITPGALEGVEPLASSSSVLIALDPAVPDAMDHARTAVAQVDASMHVDPVVIEGLAPVLADIRQALLAGTAALLLLIGASLLVNVVEQMRERRRLLAALLAFGVRRRTLSASVLLQLAVPVVLGLALAAVTGTGLSTLLQIGMEVPVRLDWAGIGTTSGVAALVVLVTTAASLPLLWRLMRPEGLRAE